MNFARWEDVTGEQPTITLFVITRSPKDRPGRFVVREHAWFATGAHFTLVTPFAVCDSLEEARGEIEEHTPSLMRVGAGFGDDEVIVESWGTQQSFDRLKEFRTGTSFAVPLGRVTQFEIPSGTPQANCKTCRKPVYWIKTPAGKNMPVDPGGTSHFATCPQAAQHRRPR